MNRFDFGVGAALVTGASRGIGAALARDLAGRGATALILTARSYEDLVQLAEELTRKYPTLRVHTVVADLAKADGAQTVYNEVERLGVPVHLLVNNAGFGSHGMFESLDVQRETDMVQVNVTSLLEMTRLFLPAMVARRGGAVLNVGSTAAFQPVPYMATYAATKAWVQSFSEALWGEMHDRKTGVKVLCLCPGGTATNFGDNLDRGKFENASQSTPEEVAKAGLDALHGDSPFVVVGTGNYLGTLAPRVLPRAMMPRVVAPMFRPSDLSTQVERGESTSLSQTAPTTERWNRSIGLWAVGAGVLLGAVLATRKTR